MPTQVQLGNAWEGGPDVGKYPCRWDGRVCPQQSWDLCSSASWSFPYASSFASNPLQGMGGRKSCPAAVVGEEHVKDNAQDITYYLVLQEKGQL